MHNHTAQDYDQHQRPIDGERVQDTTLPEHYVARVDEKGRQVPESMTDRALLVELVTSMRTVGDAVEKFSESVSGNPMLSMFGL